MTIPMLGRSSITIARSLPLRATKADQASVGKNGLKAPLTHYLLAPVA
jgi:hypothetical protein